MSLFTPLLAACNNEEVLKGAQRGDPLKAGALQTRRVAAGQDRMLHSPLHPAVCAAGAVQKAQLPAGSCWPRCEAVLLGLPGAVVGPSHPSAPQLCTRVCVGSAHHSGLCNTSKYVLQDL